MPTWTIPSSCPCSSSRMPSPNCSQALQSSWPSEEGGKVSPWGIPWDVTSRSTRGSESRVRKKRVPWHGGIICRLRVVFFSVSPLDSISSSLCAHGKTRPNRISQLPSPSPPRVHSRSLRQFFGRSHQSCGDASPVSHVRSEFVLDCPCTVDLGMSTLVDSRGEMGVEGSGLTLPLRPCSKSRAPRAGR